VEPSSTSELWQRLQSAHALRDSAAASHQAEALHRGGESGEDGALRAGNRALTANVLWLDANPDAKQDLAHTPPGVVSLIERTHTALSLLLHLSGHEGTSRMTMRVFSLLLLLYFFTSRFRTPGQFIGGHHGHHN